MAKASLRKRLLAAALAPLIVLGLLEGGLRLAGYRYDPHAGLAGDRPYDERSESRVYEPDPELLWRLRPSTVLHEPELAFRRVRTNSLGLRGSEVPREKEPGEVRVLCLGDSVTFGLDLADDETWPARLAHHLRTAPALRGRKVTVVNGGVPGWSSVQGLRLHDRLEDYRPDAVVFWFGINDAKQARGLPDRLQGNAPAARLLGGLRVWQLFQDLLGVRAEVDPGARRVSVDDYAAAVGRLREGEPPAVFVRFPERLATTIREYEGMIRRAEREGVGLVVGPKGLMIPFAPADPGTDLEGRLMRADGEIALVYDPERADTMVALSSLETDLPLLKALKRELDARLATLPESALGYRELFGDEPPPEVFSDNCHLRARGADRAARSLAEEILRRLE